MAEPLRVPPYTMMLFLKRLLELPAFELAGLNVMECLNGKLNILKSQ